MHSVAKSGLRTLNCRCFGSASRRLPSARRQLLAQRPATANDQPRPDIFSAWSFCGAPLLLSHRRCWLGSVGNGGGSCVRIHGDLGRNTARPPNTHWSRTWCATVRVVHARRPHVDDDTSAVRPPFRTSPACPLRGTSSAALAMQPMTVRCRWRFPPFAYDSRWSRRLPRPAVVGSAADGAQEGENA